VPNQRRARFVALVDLLAERGLDALVLLPAGRVIVDGRVLTNEAARVRRDASIRIDPARRLRGDEKLSYAIDSLAASPGDRIAVDVGASTGGFTTALLARGARRVYAVDAGVGQLVGRLRTDPRVVNLERTNLSQLSSVLVPEPVEFITMDLSYLALVDAIPQLEPLRIAEGAALLVLVKPTFELHRGELAVADDELGEAVRRVIAAAEGSSWSVCGWCPSAVTGRGGAREAFVHARRRPR
jgi:23S rRNA (cytidine1920-2'-O)/16S rRNA (cytidine1409-2'-O)-methyltransferase